MKIGIVGVGLIGGSMALDLRKLGNTSTIFGADNNRNHITEAINLGIIDKEASLTVMAQKCDFIVIATPVDKSPVILKQLLEEDASKAIVIDVGSIKLPICQMANKLPNRKRFVACHPIAGTEYSGPQAALQNLFKNKVNIICNSEENEPETVEQVKRLFELLGSKNILMDAATHDQHITYVSHLSHISSFALSLTVQQLELQHQNIYSMAGSGFASTVRLAKSSAEMWATILQANQQNTMDAIDAYIEQLEKLKKEILEKNPAALKKNIMHANQIKKIIDK